jgi:tryptophan synthase beta subunit
MRPDQILVVSLSGRGDKDVQQIEKMIGKKLNQQEPS